MLRAFSLFYVKTPPLYPEPGYRIAHRRCIHLTDSLQVVTGQVGLDGKFLNGLYRTDCFPAPFSNLR